MPTVQQLALAFAARHAGQQANMAAGCKAHRDDTARVTAAVRTLAVSGRAFTADDVHRVILAADPTPYDRNLVSSVLGSWAARRWIYRVPYLEPVPSMHPARHGSRNAWWRGTPTAPAPEAVGEQ